jgi:ParB-like chromosome segregation protein Spo0J
MRKKIENLALATITEGFLVRVELDHKHIEHLKDLHSSGQELPPILVSEGDNELVDGRHRLAAYRELGVQSTSCEIRKFASRAEKIMVALAANVGGSLPPTHADINHTMQILLNEGESRKSIIQMVSDRIGFPAKLVARHLDEVQANIHKVRLKRAINDVVDKGKTIHEAAALHGVKLETLKANLADKISDGKSDVNQLKSHLSVSFNRVSHIYGRNISKLARDLRDGVISEEEARDVIRHMIKLMDRLNHRHNEWVKRFEKHVGVVTTSAAMSEVEAKQSRKQKSSTALEKMGLK